MMNKIIGIICIIFMKREKKKQDVFFCIVGKGEKGVCLFEKYIYIGKMLIIGVI